MAVWNHEFNQNRMLTLTSYVQENIVRLYYKDQLVNVKTGEA
jgi:hypothetical protein